MRFLASYPYLLGTPRRHRRPSASIPEGEERPSSMSLRDVLTGVEGARSAFQEGSRLGRATRTGEPSATSALAVHVHADVRRGPHAPEGMLHLVLHGAAVPLPRVAEQVVDDEALVRALGGERPRARGPRAEPALAPALAPGELDPAGARHVGHAPRVVPLVVREPGDPRQRAAWHDLLHERDAAPLAPRHVEPEVDLLEVPVPGNGDAEEPGVQHAEPHEADEAAALRRVEPHAARHEGREGLRWDLVVEKKEVAPFRGEEGAGHARLTPT